jgi:hypothetical protein
LILPVTATDIKAARCSRSGRSVSRRRFSRPNPFPRSIICGCLIADVPAVVGSLDIVMGEIDR